MIGIAVFGDSHVKLSPLSTGLIGGSRDWGFSTIMEQRLIDYIF